MAGIRCNDGQCKGSARPHNIGEPRCTGSVLFQTKGRRVTTRAKEERGGGRRNASRPKSTCNCRRKDTWTEEEHEPSCPEFTAQRDELVKLQAAVRDLVAVRKSTQEQLDEAWATLEALENQS